MEPTRVKIEVTYRDGSMAGLADTYLTARRDVTFPSSLESREAAGKLVDDMLAAACKVAEVLADAHVANQAALAAAYDARVAVEPQADEGPSQDDVRLEEEQGTSEDE